MEFKELSALLESASITKPSSGNQRAYADLIEEHACELAKSKFPQEYRPARSVRSPEDFAIANGITSYIDVKTRQLNTEFNMPNLISVDRLDKILSDPNLELYYWLIDYEVLDNGQAIIRHSEIRTVWSLSWTALSIQNLGKGQLQISNWNNVNIMEHDKLAWHNTLRNRRRDFYTKQAEKFAKMARAIKPL